MDYNTPLGYEKLSVSTVQTLSPPRGATRIIVYCETQAIRWRDDGTNATATDGMPLATGTRLDYEGRLSTFTIVAQTGTATVHVSYYDS